MRHCVKGRERTSVPDTNIDAAASKSGTGLNLKETDIDTTRIYHEHKNLQDSAHETSAVRLHQMNNQQNLNVNELTRSKFNPEPFCSSAAVVTRDQHKSARVTLLNDRHACTTNFGCITIHTNIDTIDNVATMNSHQDGTENDNLSGIEDGTAMRHMKHDDGLDANADMNKNLFSDCAAKPDMYLSISEGGSPYPNKSIICSPSLLPLHPSQNTSTPPRHSHLASLCCNSCLCRLLSRAYERVYSSLYAACVFLMPYGGLASNSFSIASMTLGGGIISMPSSFGTSGIIAGALYVIILALITVYTITVLGYVLRSTDCQTFEQIATVLGGERWGYLVGFILWFSCIATAVGYISAVSSLVEPMVRHVHNDAISANVDSSSISSSLLSFLRTSMGNRVLTTLVWLVCMLPAVIPRRVNNTRYISAIGCVMVLYFAVVVVVHSCSADGGLRKGMRGNMTYATTENKALYGLSIFMFGYLSQAVAPPIWLEMRPRKSVRQLTIAAALATGICALLYILAGFFGYMDFGDDTRDPILYNFDPLHQPYIMVAYIGIMFKLIGSYAINMIPCRNVVYDTLGWDLDTVPFYKHALVVTLLSVLTLVLGLFIPNINLAFGLVGSLTGGSLGFIFPALAWMYCGNWSLKKVGIWHYMATYFLLVSGVVAIVFGTIATIYSTFEM